MTITTTSQTLDFIHGVETIIYETLAKDCNRVRVSNVDMAKYLQLVLKYKEKHVDVIEYVKWLVLQESSIKSKLGISSHEGDE